MFENAIQISKRMSEQSKLLRLQWVDLPSSLRRK
jgi:hypothetical protein